MKKVLIIVTTLILVFTMASCGSSSEESLTDHVEKYDSAILDDEIYWSVYFDEDFNYTDYDCEDFIDVIKECLSQDENDNDDITGYWVEAYDADETMRFAWTSVYNEDKISKYEGDDQEIEAVDQTISEDQLDDILSEIK